MAKTLQGQVLGVAISLMILPIPFVLLRFRARYLTRVKPALDDWILLAALFVNTASCIALITGATVGNLGSHESISAEGLPIVTDKHIVAFKVQYIDQIFGVTGDGLTKLSILLLYRRIFVFPTFKIINAIWIAIIVAWTISYTFAIVFQCSPINTFWTSPFAESTPGKCVQIYPMYLSLAVTDVLTDAMVLALPIPVVLSLQMPLRRRITIMGVFMLGGLVLAFGIIRIKVFYVVVDQAKKSLDLSYIFAKTFYWTIAETAGGIICACLPTLAPIFNPALKGSIAHGLSSSGLRIFSRQSTTKASSGWETENSGKRGTNDRSGHTTSQSSVEQWDPVGHPGETRWATEPVMMNSREHLTNTAQRSITVKQDVYVNSV